MSRNRSFLLGVIVTIGAVALVMAISQMPARAAADAAAPAPPETPGHVDAPAHVDATAMKIVVVNMNEVFDKMKERSVREDDLNRRRQDLQAEIQKMTDEAQSLLKSYDSMKPDDPKRNETQEKIVQLQSDAETTYKKGMSMLTRRGLGDRQELYAIIRDAIDKYAADNKITLVLKVDDKRVSDNADTQTAEMGQRAVLHSDPSLDVTADIIKIVNKE